MFFKNKQENSEYSDREFDDLLKELAEQGPIFHDNEEEDR